MSNIIHAKTKNKNTNQIDSLIEKTVERYNIKLNKTQQELLAQIIRFLIVGGIATLIDLGIFFILCQFVKLNPLIAVIISFTISVIYNYWASCKYVYNVSNNKPKVVRFTGFVILSVIGLSINELLLFIFVSKLLWNYMLVKIIATIIVMIFNFLTRKYYLEK